QSPVYQELHPFEVTPRRTPADLLVHQVGKGSLSEGSATSSVTRKISMTQDRYLGRRLTDRQAADVLEDMFTEDTKTVPKTYSDLEDEPAASP
ncbi:hypothetical protein ACFU8R_24405, partial [Pseudonocardia alni]|uniref:hypothetical protein n=1 Tax=Pseudonocardia alni TaxID=33907 RepID=UPI0036CD2516